MWFWLGWTGCFLAAKHREPLSEALDVAAGLDVACTLLGNGDVLRCWTSSAAAGWTPPPDEGSGPWRQVAVGFDHACALRDSGAVDCWGAAVNFEEPSPDLAFRDGSYEAIRSGVRQSCGRDASGWNCWSTNEGFDRYQPSLEGVADLTVWDGACAVIDGVAQCWGFESGPYDTDGNPDFSGIEAAQVSAGLGGVCVRSTGGQIWCSVRGSFGWETPQQVDDGVDGHMARPGEQLSVCSLKGGDIDCVGPITYFVGPYLPIAGPWSKVEAGEDYVCGISADEGTDPELHCFGADGETEPFRI